MRLLATRNYSKVHQYVISILIITATTIVCAFSVNFIGYQAVALVLLLAVSFNAILFDIFPVLLSALLSALIWNFLFIPPIFTFRIDNAEDILIFLMYFVVALINAVLTFKIRRFQQKVEEKESKEKSIKLYNTLLNSLSHELRTPISTIIGAIDTIMDNPHKISEKNKNELYNEIEIASFRLNRQVENLLSMSRLEAGFIQPKNDWCDINEIIFSATKELKNESKNHNIEFTPNDNLPLFKLDSGLIEQILRNLIHNALQYTPKNSTITIEVNNDDNNCSITVFDNGNGFPQNKIDFVFDKFYRLNNAVSGGTGLGLSIVKGFTEAMNGKVELKNSPEGGAKFTIEIPVETSYINNLKNE
ncbi:sensor histidine kinase [Yeosuana marina]|uniref:sensor histidine kinase n=1 Tax=Yeosuana marina TaxID=1565536 RepID=UPI0030C8D306